MTSVSIRRFPCIGLLILADCVPAALCVDSFQCLNIYFSDENFLLRCSRWRFDLRLSFTTKSAEMR